MRLNTAAGVRRLCTVSAVGLLTTFALADAPNAKSAPDAGVAPQTAAGVSTQQLRRQFTDAHPGAMIIDGVHGDRVTGSALANGDSPVDAASAAVADIAPMFGARAEDFVAGADHLPQGVSTVPMMYDRATGTYKFTAVYHQQQRGGVPVYGARVTSVVRNVPGNPVVLVNPDVRDLGGLEVPADAGRAAPIAAGQNNARDFAGGDDSVILSSRRVIWAGLNGQPEQPTLADEMVVINGYDQWRIITDAQTGNVLHDEYLIQFGVNGTASGNGSDGPGSADCAPEILKPLPYARISDGFGGEIFTDANGNFTASAGSPLTMTLNGMWFDVSNFLGAEVSETATAQAPLEIIFGEGGASEQVQAQINAYIEANVVRDFVLQFNPSYPTLSSNDFPVTVNRTDGFCPGNAWYDPTEVSINFCLSGSSNPNTSWSSVVYHEYGHHLVAAAGSGQGQYGEGMGDVMSTIILDDHRLALGFFGTCNEALRDADNTIQYPCNDEIHFCGQLIAGCVWDTRNALVAASVPNYTDVLANMAINAMLVHSGSSITPQIAIDYAVLDDDNGDLNDGTPHLAQIAEGFRAHNMLPAELETVRINFPSGLADFAAPDGSTSMQIEVLALDGNVVPNSVVMHVDNGSGFQSVVMNSAGGDLYEASFPGEPCGSQLSYYFTADSTSGVSATSPSNAPSTSYSVVSAYSAGDLRFEDNFQTDQGWGVSTTATAGAWERGVPVDNNRGDPPTDADGSGQCYLTENDPFDSNSDVDSGSTTLTSPIMDASGGNVLISYWRWFSNDSGDGANTDPFTVEVSDDGGASWQSLEVVGPSGPGTSGGWIRAEFNLDDLSGFTPSNQFRIRFTAVDNDPQSIVEAAVDGVKLSTLDCEPPVQPCPADIAGAGDGVVDVFDLFELLNNWGTSGAGADLAAPNNVVDVFDLFELLSAWGACTP